jgi:hypothetical protein
MFKFVCMIIRLLFALLFFSSYLSAQNCGTDRYHDWMMQTDSNYRIAYRNKERIEHRFISSGVDYSRGTTTCNQNLIIPIVVHIIHRGESEGVGSNIADSIVHQAMQGINEYYANENIGINTNIRFVLAKRDPNGNATDGINRINGSIVPDYFSNGIKYTSNCGANVNAIKDLSRWPTDKYYNVWIVHNICGGGIAGFANYPAPGQTYDGAVIMADYFNYYSTTFAHEAGHGLNLYHTFSGDADGSICPSDNHCYFDGDRVCDTPPHRRDDCINNLNPCTGNLISWPNSLYNNMSYCFPPPAYARFTQGQITRMQNALVNMRWELYNNENIIPPDSIDLVCIKPTDSVLVLPCAGLKDLSFSVFNFGTSPITTFDIAAYIDNSFITQQTYNTTIAPGAFAIVEVNNLPLSTGNNAIKAVLTSVNNANNDLVLYNNEVCYTINIPAAESLYPLCYTQPDVDYMRLFYYPFRKYYLPNGFYTYDAWTLSLGQTCGPSGFSLKFPYIQNEYYGVFDPDSLKDYDFYLPPITVGQQDTTVLSFYRAAKYPFSNNSYMDLQVLASIDCGETWVNLYYKNNIGAPVTVGGNTYTPSTESICNIAYSYPNGAPETPSFNPSSCSQWVKEHVGLGQFAGQEVLLNFKARKFDNSGYGECIFIDDICIKNCAPNYIPVVSNYTINEGDSVVVGNNAYHQQGSYTDTLQTLKGCDSIVVSNVTVLIGINEQEANGIKVYPNPATNTLFIEFDNYTTDNKPLVRLLDITGKVIVEFTATDKRISLNVENLPNAVYLLNILTQNASINRRFIKQ